IGAMSADEAQALFPGKTIVAVKLDPAHPLPGTAAAWEVLDAIVSEAGPAAGATATTYRTLLGSGVIIAVRSPQAPDSHWPWRRQGAWWVLRHDPLGPASALNEAGYTPVMSWSPGAPAHARATVLALGVLLAIAALA